MQLASSNKVLSGPETGRRFNFVSAFVAAFIAIAGIAFVQQELRIGRAVAAPVVAAPAVVHAASDVAQPAARARSAEDDSDIEALVDTVARRYRVSSLALHDVVETAYDEARRNKLDPLLVLAVIAIESRFNPIAQSEMGALGLMQIIPRFHEDKLADASTADDGGDAMLDPQVNIRVGTQVLKEYIRRTGSEAAALQLYSGSSDSAGGGAYAAKVNAERQRLGTLLKKARAALRGHLT